MIPAPDLPELTVATLWEILNDRLDDAIANQLVWQALGYRYDATNQTWEASQVASDWRETYPEPPDFIESRPATVKLTRSIPEADKQLLKEKLGFKGYKIGELIPRKTRRATMVNWLLSHMNQTGQLLNVSLTHNAAEDLQ